MRIAEHFYSLQGEGATMGVPAVFLRLSGCNLLCGGQGTIEDGQLHDGATWRCDTIEVWAGRGQKMTPSEIVELFSREGYLRRLAQGAHLVITGGEPLQQHEEIVSLICELTEALHDRPFVEIETNGTLIPSVILLALVNQWNVSPKLSSSGMPAERRINQDALRVLACADNAWCKVVISCEDDLKELDDGLTDPTRNFFSRQILLMPAASDREALRKLLPIVAEHCKEKGYRLSSRMQVEIWDKTTGV